MALSREITLTIDNYNITLDKEIKIYEYDAINLCFTIQEYGIVMRDGKAHNRIMPVVALKAYMLIETPQGVDSVEATNIVRNKIIFSLGNKYSQFVGVGKMQIILRDLDGCRITLPEFNYEVKQSINTGWEIPDVLVDEKDFVVTDELGRPIVTTKISEMDEVNEITPQTYTVVINEDGNKKIKLDTIMESISETNVEEIDRRIDEMIEVYDDEEIEVEFPSLHNDVERIKGEINEISESLDNSVNKNIKRLSMMLSNNEVTNIKVVSDSFGVGVGTTNGGEDTNGKLIGTTGKHEGKKDTPCWANYFRDYISKKYPSVSFFNASIGGYGMKNEGLVLKDKWYGTNNDVILVMLGANDRIDVTSEADFKSVATQFLSEINKTCKYMIVCSQNNPLDEYTNGVLKDGFVITMEQVDKILNQVCTENGYTFISLYNKVKQFISTSGIDRKMLLRTEKEGITDYLHPNDEGSLLIWEILQQELGILEDSQQMTRLLTSAPNTIFDVYTDNTLNNPITEYKKGSFNSFFVANPKAQNEGFPGGYGGVLTVVRHINDSFSYQEFKSFQGQTIATRNWNTSKNNWNDFFLLTPVSGGVFRWAEISGDLPNVTDKEYYIMKNSSATNVTNLTSSVDGVRTIIFADGNTTLKKGYFKLKDNVDWTPTIFSSITVAKCNLTGAWIELSRTQI